MILRRILLAAGIAITVSITSPPLDEMLFPVVKRKSEEYGLEFGHENPEPLSWQVWPYYYAPSLETVTGTLNFTSSLTTSLTSATGILDAHGTANSTTESRTTCIGERFSKADWEKLERERLARALELLQRSIESAVDQFDDAGEEAETVRAQIATLSYEIAQTEEKLSNLRDPGSR